MWEQCGKGTGARDVGAVRGRHRSSTEAVREKHGSRDGCSAGAVLCRSSAGEARERCKNSAGAGAVQERHGSSTRAVRERHGSGHGCGAGAGVVREREGSSAGAGVVREKHGRGVGAVQEQCGRRSSAGKAREWYQSGEEEAQEWARVRCGSRSGAGKARERCGSSVGEVREQAQERCGAGAVGERDGSGAVWCGSGAVRERCGSGHRSGAGLRAGGRAGAARRPAATGGLHFTSKGAQAGAASKASGLLALMRAWLLSSRRGAFAVSSGFIHLKVSRPPCLFWGLQVCLPSQS